MRVVTGIIAIPLVIGIVWYGSPWLFLLLVAIAVLAGCYEYFSMISRTGIDGFPVLGGVLSQFLLASFYFNNDYLIEGWKFKPCLLNGKNKASKKN